MTTLALQGTPPLIIHPHPLVGDGRIVETAAFLPRETLGRYMERTGVAVPNGPIHVWHNGRPVSSELWDLLIPRTGDQIVIRARALGGGDGSKVLRTVAMLALVLSAPYIAGYALTGTWTAATGFSGALLTGAVTLGGSLIITPLLPEIVQ